MLPTAQCEKWQEYCGGMYDMSDSEDMNEIHEPMTAETEPEPALDEIAWAIKNLKNGKSPGCDEIPAGWRRKHTHISCIMYKDLEIWYMAKRLEENYLHSNTKKGQPEIMHQL